MIAPLGAPSMAEAVRAGAEVYAALRRELTGRKLSTGLGDEGGFAPEITEPEDVLRLLVQAISDAGYTAGPRRRVDRAGPGGLGVPAAGRPLQGRRATCWTAAELIDRLAAITDEFPVHLIEDGLGEDDDEGWIALTARLGGKVELVGDDIFCTNPAIITRAIERGIANASLIKLNQIGTVTETLEAMAVCRQAGLPAVRLAPLRRDRGQLHRRPRRGHRLRPPQVRRARPRRADRQVQPAARDRRRRARPPLRHGLTVRHVAAAWRRAVVRGASPFAGGRLAWGGRD